MPRPTALPNQWADAAQTAGRGPAQQPCQTNGRMLRKRRDVAPPNSPAKPTGGCCTNGGTWPRPTAPPNQGADAAQTAGRGPAQQPRQTNGGMQAKWRTMNGARGRGAGYTGLGQASR
jgi:hypothetical protein